MLSKGPGFTAKMWQFCGGIQPLWTLQHSQSWKSSDRFILNQREKRDNRMDIVDIWVG